MAKGFGFHCPLCGAKLIEFEHPGIDSGSDYFDKTEELENDPIKLKEYEDQQYRLRKDRSVWCKCDNCKSFGESFPLVLHHPLRGMDSEPGDSWSITWLK